MVYLLADVVTCTSLCALTFKRFFNCANCYFDAH